MLAPISARKYQQDLRTATLNRLSHLPLCLMSRWPAVCGSVAWHLPSNIRVIAATTARDTTAEEPRASELEGSQSSGQWERTTRVRADEVALSFSAGNLAYHLIISYHCKPQVRR